MSLARGEAWLSLNERLSSGRSQLEIPQIEREIHAGRKAWLFVGTKVVYVTEEEHGQADGNQLQQYNEERTPLCHECNTEAQVRQLECTIYRIYWYWVDLFMTRGGEVRVVRLDDQTVCFSAHLIAIHFGGSSLKTQFVPALFPPPCWQYSWCKENKSSSYTVRKAIWKFLELAPPTVWIINDCITGGR